MAECLPRSRDGAPAASPQLGMIHTLYPASTDTRGMEYCELVAVLKDVGSFSMDDFRGRLTPQKTVCLLQAFGVNLGYRFTWCLHEPYCKALVKIGYAARLVVDDLPEIDISFEGEPVQRRYEQFKVFMADKKSNATLLEIRASMYYLAAAGIGRADILKLTEKKANFSRRQCVSVWSELEMCGVAGNGIA